MTQRIFDIENEKDMQDLWNIVPDDASYAKKTSDGETFYSFDGLPLYYACELININWHDKTEITRPIQEATEQDIGKICAFWNKNINDVSYGKLLKIDERFNPNKYQARGEWGFIHCRRLTKQEIEELC